MLKKKQNAPAKKLNPREIHKKYISRVEEELTNEGVVFWDAELGNLNVDSEYLSLPYDITEVSSRELGKYLNAFTQQKLFLRTLLGRIDCVVKELRMEYYSLSSDMYKKLTDRKISETAKERMLMTYMDTEEHGHIYSKYLDSVEKKSLIELSIANIEDAIFLLSREVSRRTGDFKDESRLEGIQ